MLDTCQHILILLSSWITSMYLIPLPMLCCAIGMLLSMGILCGGKLAAIHIPDRPLLSPLLRHVGIAAMKASQLVILSLLVIGSFAAYLFYVNGTLFSHYQETSVYGLFFIIGLAAGVAVSLPVIYRWLPIWERGNGLDDVAHLTARLKKLARGFNPENYFSVKKGVFLGLDEKRSPLWVPKEAIQKNHLQIIGESGTGKSSLAGVLLAQSALLGEAVVVIDPKNDVYLASALARIAEKNNIPFRLLDLRPGAPPQLNPLAGCEPWQVEELLIAGFELGKTGEPGSDYYRGEDRDACGEVAQLYAAGSVTIPSLFQACAKNSAITERSNLWREFRQFASLPAFHAREGLDMERIINDGGILYIIGSITSDKVFAAQRLLLQRILQIISERNPQNARPVALMLDEIKYVLSVPAVRALGTVRDRSCHIIVAHQSLNDLSDCPGLQPKAVRGAIHGNTSVKVVYKLNEFETAQEFEGIGGMEKTYVENINSVEEHHSRGWRESERPRVRADLLTHLPKPIYGEASVGVLFGLGTTKLLSTRYLDAGQTPSIVEAEADDITIAVEELI